jgi:hypothetical protein
MRPFFMVLCLGPQWVRICPIVAVAAPKPRCKVQVEKMARAERARAVSFRGDCANCPARGASIHISARRPFISAAVLGPTIRCSTISSDRRPLDQLHAAIVTVVDAHEPLHMCASVTGCRGNRVPPTGRIGRLRTAKRKRPSALRSRAVIFRAQTLVRAAEARRAELPAAEVDKIAAG